MMRFQTTACDMDRRQRFRLRGWMGLFYVAGFMLIMSGDARGQTEAKTPPPDRVTTASVEKALKELESTEGLDETVKTKVQEIYQNAQQALKSEAAWTTALAEFEKKIQTTPAESLKLEAELAVLNREPLVQVPKAPLAQLEKTLAEKERALKEAQTALAKWEDEPKRQSGRRAEIPKLIVAARKRLAEAEGQLKALAASPDGPEKTARRTALLAHCQAASQEIAASEKELDAYDSLGKLYSLQRDLLTGQLAAAKHVATRWRDEVNKRRHDDAQEALEQAQDSADKLPAALSFLAERNADLAAQRTELALQIPDTTRQLEETNDILTALQADRKWVNGKVEAVGFTNTIGRLLRSKKSELPDVRDYERSVDSRQATIREVEYNLLVLDERRAELANLKQEIKKALATAGLDENGGVGYLEDDIRQQLETEKEYLDKLISDKREYFKQLLLLNSAEQQLIAETEEYARFINERVLWVRSTDVSELWAFAQYARGAMWLLHPESWGEFVRDLAVDAIHHPLLSTLAILVLITLGYGRRQFRHQIVALGSVAGKANCYSIRPTFEACAWTLMVAIVWPGLLGYIAWRTIVMPDFSAFSKAAGAGFGATATVLFVLELLRQMSRERGLLEAHFGWPSMALRPLRHYLMLGIASILPLTFVAAMLDAQATERWINSLGRLAFVASLLVFAHLFHRALRAGSGIHLAIQAEFTGTWFNRLRVLWYPAGVFLPLSLAVLAVAGYYYSAQQLAQRMILTAYILVGLMVLRSFLLRWLLVRRRKLAIEQARQRRASEDAAAAAASLEPDVADVVPAAAEPEVCLATINEQTRRLVEYALAVTAVLGIWFVWVDVLPALGILDRFKVWDAQDPTAVLTAADLVIACLAVATTWIAAANVPGLLQMALLERLPLDTGLRYTIGTMVRYLIVLIGILVACNVLGLSWNKVQWLIAAVGVGLGFGLQEIFANFVSGLIILFERPVRVGDIVTVDDVTGVISRIRIRATTITNWDRKELIVPNKEFITGRVLNWTLSDRVNRVVINVGVAYGSDTELATELLLKIATEHPRVLEDPAPRVTFEGFGDSALTFVLRCFLPSLEKRLDVIHSLHTSIDKAFREAGIEIAFPQRDVHVRTISPAFSNLVPATAPAPDTPPPKEKDEVSSAEDPIP
ncbi:MAG: mechanosensitive ion channel [Pirellulales bacterium]|nr:mechanosensitive ion channel [Pirellulales bacterium]